MRLLTLAITGYRQFLEETRLEIPAGLTGICGPNGVGKSKLIEAIGFALFGPKSVLPASDGEDDLASAAGAGKVFPQVTLVVESYGHVYRIFRGRKGKTKSKDCRVEELVRDSDGTEVAHLIATTPSGVTKKVVELFGITPEAYLRTFVARQKEIAGIQSMKGDKDRQQLINRMIGLSQVEKALAFAETERKARKDRLAERIEEEGTAANVSVAEDNLKQANEQLEEARDKEAQRQTALDLAKQETATARGVLEERKRQAAEAQRMRDECDQLETAFPALEQILERAKTLQGQADTASALVAWGEEILRETADAEANRLRYETLSQIATAKADYASAKESFESLSAKHAEYEKLLEEIRTAESNVVEKTSTVSRCEADLHSLKRDRDAALTDIERAKSNIETVTEMGPDGACSRCGQRLGGNLADALRHLKTEQEQAEGRCERASTAVDEADSLLNVSREKLTAAILHRNNLERTRQENTELPGKLAKAREQVDEASQILDSYNADLREQEYDSAAHEAAESEVKRRQEAEAIVRANAALADQAGSARESVEGAHRQCEQNRERRETLTGALTALAEVEAAVQDAAQELANQQEQESTASEEAKAAVAATAQAQTGVTIAEERLHQATERRLRLQQLESQVEIADRTMTLIRATRDEITAEACPRLSEMMDTWARSLMGPHFTMVRLTSDYRLEADNGSGVHPLDHFSGGEQTLLAVMLRVAISLYCQERAGMGAGFLILDEVFGDQDELHRAQLVQFLNEIKPHYHQIVIVNHVADVTQMLDSIVDVEPTGERTSRARIRRR